MTDTAQTTSLSSSPIPADDPNRKLTVADPDGVGVRHVSVVGGTYTILVSGVDTVGRYCLIDMLVPDGAGPPAHRHDFEEMFTLLEGELEFFFRGQAQTVRAGSTVNIPANAPTSSGTCRARRSICSACARHQDKKSSSWRSASPPTVGRLRHRGPARKCKPRSSSC